MSSKSANSISTQTPTKKVKRSSSVPIKKEKSNKNTTQKSTPSSIINPQINSKRLEKETSEWIKRQRQIDIDKNKNLTDKSPSSYYYIKSNKASNKPNKTPLKTIRSQPVYKLYIIFI